jgi:DNA-binding NtrC family response regulator
MPTFSAAKIEAIREFERTYLLQTLRHCGGNVSAAARKAGKERSAFGKLVKKYGLCKWQLLGPTDI